MNQVKFKFWGVRGSMAIPGKDTERYGGNTTCIEIQSGKDHIILDGGTGIRMLGADIMKHKGKRSFESFILLSHVHWDHYIGLPFFKPFYWSRNKFVVAGPRAMDKNFATALSKAVCPPYFPVRLSELNANIRLKTISQRAFKAGSVIIVPLIANHPNGAFGWRMEFPNGKSAVVMTDNEPSGKKQESKLLDALDGVDVLIHDAQYTPQNYKKRKGWGHSPFTYPIWLAAQARIKRVFLTHFDPDDSDKRLDAVSMQALRYAKKQKNHVRCVLAREGLSFNL
ncbi:MAG: MBL fold metallo-hydrolase [Pseudomonadota bacterium]